MSGRPFFPSFRSFDSIGLGSRTLTPAYREFVTFVDENTEPNAIFSGWTWSSPWWLSIETDRTIKDRSRYPFEQRESIPEDFVITPESPIAGKLCTGWPNMSYASRWSYEQNEKRRDFAEHHCTHLLTTGDEHKWTIYRINPLPAGAVK